MSPQVHHFVGNSFAAYLSYLSNAFGAELIDNAIEIPASMGKGFIKQIELEEGFGLRYYDFTLNQDLQFNILYEDTELVYRVLYILKDSLDVPTDTEEGIIMYTSEVEMKGFIKKGVHFYRIALIFNASWLENNYTEATTRIGKLIQSFILKNKPVVISKDFDSKSHTLTKQLSHGLTNRKFPLIQIKMISIILINEFLNRIIDGEEKEVLSDQTIHYYTMLEVEKKIMNCLKCNLPGIEDLAAEFNLSSSTLKRHFKIVFGKNIFEFYQEKRMLWGKKQIEYGHKNINEIAYELGFSKVNNFSKAFKKQFHYLPRDLKFKKIAV